METTAGRPGSGDGPALDGPWRCRWCREPVTVTGEPHLGKAVHTATGKELGPGGHLAAPIDVPLAQPAVTAGVAPDEGARSCPGSS